MRHPIIEPPNSRFLLHLATFALLLLVAGLSLPGEATARAENRSNSVSLKQTYEAYLKIPDLTEAQQEYGRQRIPQLSYNTQRILRKLCTLPGTDFETARSAMDILNAQKFTFLQAQAFESYCGLSDMRADIALNSLQHFTDLNYQVARSLQAYLKLPGVTSHQAIPAIAMFSKMGDGNNRAAQALCKVPSIQLNEVHQGIALIARLRDGQARAAEAYAGLDGVTPAIMLDTLDLVRRITEDNAWNARWLFLDKSLNAQQAWDWMVSYFALSRDHQEAQYDRMDSQRKSILLHAYYQGGTKIIWKINNLHAVTDHNGYEISEAALARWSLSQLRNKFDELPGAVRNRFGASMANAGQGQAVGILRQATSAGRVQAARDLIPANAYAVMAQAGDLYDSSFRNILVPVLKEWINAKYQGDLLQFLRDTDPENQLVSDFIVSCAQKGKLTDFFPADSSKQEQILALVAGSAFRNEDSILLFSATLTPLLKILEPSARSYLIQLMIQEASESRSAFTVLITVTLQYYLQTYPELLGSDDRTSIARLLAQNGAANLEQYQVTPFAEWKADGRIASVSMFHPDDDGRQSFVSNANLLLRNGYRLTNSHYTVGNSPGLGGYSSGNMSSLFEAMRRSHFAVAFEKQVNGVRIIHNQVVYSDEENQATVLQRFILSDDEILAQRGHSYWRTEQVIDPVKQLLEEQRISHADLQRKQRFLSLGSCGGVKVYTTLTRLFDGSVDILATIGTGLALINDPYNKQLPEIVATNSSSITWKNVAQQTAPIFQGGQGQDYLLPGSLTAILHKILEEMHHSGNAYANDQGDG